MFYQQDSLYRGSEDTMKSTTLCQYGLIFLLIILVAGCVQTQEQPQEKNQESFHPESSDISSSSEGISSAVITQTQPTWGKSILLTTSGSYLIIKSSGIPNHPTGTFPTMADTNHDNRPDNPNSIKTQNYQYKIPLHPTKASSTTKLPMGPIGIALNGAVFFNPFNAENQDAIKVEVFDSCQGHPEMKGRYHYHQLSNCIETGNVGHSFLIGYAFDGFGIYGPYEDTRKIPTPLDSCNGHTNAKLGYHYHTTSTFPYMIGCYTGVVEKSNFDQAGGGGNPLPPR